MKPWIIRNSEYVLKDQWLTVRADRCETPSGHILDPYYVLEYTDWVHVVAFDDRMRVLLVRLYRHGTGKIDLEIPSGRMEEGETAEEAARRELLEETGCACDRLIHLSSMTPNSATHTNRSNCLVGYGCRKVADPDPDESEEIECEWMEVPELLKRIDSGEFYQSLQISGILVALRHAGLLKFSAPR